MSHRRATTTALRRSIATNKKLLAIASARANRRQQSSDVATNPLATAHVRGGSNATARECLHDYIDELRELIDRDEGMLAVQQAELDHEEAWQEYTAALSRDMDAVSMEGRSWTTP